MRVAIPARAPRRVSQARSRNVSRAVWYVAVFGLSIAMLLPFFWLITTALKGNSQIYKIPPEIFPSEFHWENFRLGMEQIDFSTLFRNTLLIALATCAGQVTSSMIVGYGLARINFPGKRIWFYLFIGSMMLPTIVTLFPLFHLFQSLGWYDTWLPLIVPAWFGNPFFIFLAHQYYMSIPRTLDEAAMIDGANHWTIFTQIMVPLTRPVWITMLILGFQASWNDYLNPLVYLASQEKWTLSLGIASLSGSFAGVSTTKWNLFMATNLLYMLPPLILFFVAQRYFMQGLASLGGTHK